MEGGQIPPKQGEDFTCGRCSQLQLLSSWVVCLPNARDQRLCELMSFFPSDKPESTSF